MNVEAYRAFYEAWNLDIAWRIKMLVHHYGPCKEIELNMKNYLELVSGSKSLHNKYKKSKKTCDAYYEAVREWKFERQKALWICLRRKDVSRLAAGKIIKQL